MTLIDLNDVQAFDPRAHDESAACCDLAPKAGAKTFQY
jgi:hypothetical protein